MECNNKCLTCIGSSEYECKSCVDNYYYTGSECNNCNSVCLLCFGNETNQCYSCISGYYYVPETF